MHQTDSLFHKRAAGMGFIFGFDVDNHAINTVPKETLVKITLAEKGGLNGQGAWSGATANSPGNEGRTMQEYLGGRLVSIKGRLS
jgi:nitrate reductase alpha subunit